MTNKEKRCFILRGTSLESKLQNRTTTTTTTPTTTTTAQKTKKQGSESPLPNLQ